LFKSSKIALKNPKFLRKNKNPKIYGEKSQVKVKKKDKGPSINDVRSQAGGGLSSADMLRTREVLQMRTSALFDAKNSEFFEIYGVSAKTMVERG